MAVRWQQADPSAALEAAFARIERERMAGLPLLNPALRVQAIGFERQRGHWLGALLTPWFLNLVLVPGSAAGWRAAGDGERVFHRFAAGDFAFLGHDEPEVGAFQCCSLVSPVADFGDQAAAQATARAALRMLQVERPAATLAAADAAPPKPSRRSLLLGRRGG